MAEPQQVQAITEDVPASDHRVRIIDLGAPTARVMREMLDSLPPSLPRDEGICVNPFDPAVLDEVSDIDGLLIKQLADRLAAAC